MWHPVEACPPLCTSLHTPKKGWRLAHPSAHPCTPVKKGSIGTYITTAMTYRAIQESLTLNLLHTNLIRNIQFYSNLYIIYVHSIFGITFILYLLKSSARKGLCIPQNEESQKSKSSPKSSPVLKYAIIKPCICKKMLESKIHRSCLAMKIAMKIVAMKIAL